MAKQGNKEKIGKEALNIKQQKFCKLYATSKDFFAHGTNSYIEAYDLTKDKKGFAIARTNASRLLVNANILLYINELLESQGLNNGFVDKQLLFLINQNADFKSKLGAIKEYNQLMSRIKQRIKIEGIPKDIKLKYF